MSLFNSLLIFNEGRSREEFRVALTQETRTQRKDGNSGSHRIVQVNTLHLWCLNPAIAFDVNNLWQQKNKILIYL